MSRVDNFVLFAPTSDSLPRLPWADELVPTEPQIARWQQLDHAMHGDGVCGAVYVWGLVTNHRNADQVIDAFLAHSFDGGDAVLLVQRDGNERAEVYVHSGTTTIKKLLAPGPVEPCGGDS